MRWGLSLVCSVYVCPLMLELALLPLHANSSSIISLRLTPFFSFEACVEVSLIFGLLIIISSPLISKITSTPGFKPIASLNCFGITTWPFCPTFFLGHMDTD